MKSDKTEETQETVVEEARERMRQAQDFYNQSRQLSDDDLEFVMGDSDNLLQWDEDVRTTMMRNGKVMITVNVTAQHCNQVINNIRMNRPQGQVMPLAGGATSDSAGVVEDFIRATQSKCNADDAHDGAMEQAVYSGEGYWRILIDYVSPDSFQQGIKILPINNYNNVLIDPSAQLPDKSDAEWGFFFDRVSKEQCEREHPDVDASSWVNDDVFVTDDEIIRAEYFYCEYTDDVLEKYENGQVGFKSDNEQKLPAVESRKVKKKAWKWCKLLGGEDEPVETTDWPGQTCPIVGCYGKSFVVNDVHYYKGMVRDLKDPARFHNYAYSSAVEQVSLQPKAPFVGSAEAIAGHEEWATANQVNYSILPYNQYDAEGRPLDKPQRSEPPQIPAAHIQLMQLSTEEMRAASGQSAANFGVKSEASSGVGIQRLKAQGEVATFHYPDNLARALRYEMQVLVDLMPHVLEDGQIIRTLGIDGKEKKIAISYQMQDAYQDSNNPAYAGIFNPSVGKYDCNISTGPSYQTQRQETAEILSNVAMKDNTFMQKAGDLFFKALDVPLADELAKRYQKFLPPEAQDHEGGTPEEQAAMQVQQLTQQTQEMDNALKGATQHVQQLNEQLQKLQQEAKQKDAQLAQSESKRMITEIQAKQAQSLLSIEKAKQSLSLPKGMRMNPQTGEAEPIDDMPEEQDETNPELQAILFKLEETASEQRELLAMMVDGQSEVIEQLSKPKVSELKISKDAQGNYVGQKIEQ